ncbi:MAG: hypothetical protein J7K21_00385 [Desulfurococcales archaeon]|nr:hypothetical protein [Desulfurococcales archaeon]
MSRSFPQFILHKLWSIQDSLDLVGFKSVLLNDFTTILYGVPRLINELRILVKPTNKGFIELISDTIARELGLLAFKNDIKRFLESQGMVRVNPVTIPITYIVLANSEFYKSILEDSRWVELNGYRVRIPELEPYIGYLFSLGLSYPHIVDVITLLIIHCDRIDIKRLSKYNVTRSAICGLIRDLYTEVSMFYEIEDIVSKAIEKYC